MDADITGIRTQSDRNTRCGALRSGGKTMILIRGAALKERGLHAAGRIDRGYAYVDSYGEALGYEDVSRSWSTRSGTTRRLGSARTM